MKFLITILLTALLAFAFGLYLPWWSLAIAAFSVGLCIRQKPVWAFLSAFLSLFLLWGVMAWIMSSNNNHILAHRMSQLILKQDSPTVLILVTALIGSLIAGLAGLSASLLSTLLKKQAA